MSPDPQRLYEISLAISPEGTVEAVADRALTAYVQHLDCDGGAVFERREDADRTVSKHATSQGNSIERVTGTLRERGEGSLPAAASLPLRGETGTGEGYWLLDLPDFGALLLVSDAGRLPVSTVESLDALNEKLAETCRRTRREMRLREERTRFEAVFETSHEPLVNVLFEDDEPIVQRVNDAFVETFGYDHSEAVGANLNELVVPETGDSSDGAHHLDREARQGNPVTSEVRRETADGIGKFRFRAVPVDATDGDEHFGMYVDITEETERRKKLEDLYSDLEEILAGDDAETICTHVIGTATEILDVEIASVLLYDRATEALVPTATTEHTGIFDAFPAIYNDQASVVWETYETGEPVRIDDFSTFEGRLPPDDTSIGSALISPLGDHGVLVVSDEEADAFDATDVQFVRLLSTLTEIALNRTVRERGLEGIQRITQQVLDEETHEAIARTLMAEIPTVLDLPMSAIWRYDSGNDVLEPLEVTAKAEQLFERQPVFTGGDSIAWEVFQQGETRMVPDISSEEQSYNPNTPLGSEIVTPIGDFGILATGSTHEASFTETERRLVETLASNVETAMRLVSWRRELELLDQVLARVLRHNIRNDLTVIKGLATTIADTSEGETEASAKRIVERCNELESTADNAREMRQIVRSRDETVSVTLSDAVDHAVGTLRTEYEEVPVTYSFDARPTVTAHSDLTTAIRHLVENAIVHADSDDPIEIRLFEDGDSVGVEVSDDGQGIPDSEIETLTRHGESALEHGSGAGLWIVERIVDYSDASLAFDTHDGTTVTIRFDT